MHLLERNTDSVQLFVDEIYYNPSNHVDVFFAYIADADMPVAYGTTFYYPNEALALLTSVSHHTL